MNPMPFSPRPSSFPSLFIYIHSVNTPLSIRDEKSRFLDGSIIVAMDKLLDIDVGECLALVPVQSPQR
jgi:hypothetical protein